MLVEVDWICRPFRIEVYSEITKANNAFAKYGRTERNPSDVPMWFFSFGLTIY